MAHTLVLNTDASPIGLLPFSTLNWQDAVKAIYVGAVVPVHEYDAWVVHSQNLVMRIPSVVMTKGFVKFRKTIAFTKENVFLRDDYRCQYCGKKFHYSVLTYDHVIPRSKGGKTNYDNICCSCGPCNHKRGDNEKIKPLKIPVRPTYYQLVETRRKYPVIVSDESWIPYIGWDEDLVSVVRPNSLPGIKSEPDRLMKTIMQV